MEENFDQVIASKSDAELADIYVNRSNYQPNFYNAAVAEISVRNIDTQPLDEQIKKTFDAEITRLETARVGSAAYIVICFLLALVGGIAGIIGGYIYAFSKTRGPDNEQYYVYDHDTRKYGRMIFWLGVVVLTISLYIKL